MQLKTVVFLGAKKIGYDCLHHLISQQGDLHFQLTAVLGSPAKRSGVVQDVQALALSAGIPVLNHLDEVPPCDFLISVQYHEILRASHLDRKSVV